jgi:hypothetical protein
MGHVIDLEPILSILTHGRFFLVCIRFPTALSLTSAERKSLE